MTAADWAHSTAICSPATMTSTPQSCSAGWPTSARSCQTTGARGRSRAGRRLVCAGNAGLPSAHRRVRHASRCAAPETRSSSTSRSTTTAERTQLASRRTDLESHERGYPTLLGLTRLPVGALVLADRAVAGDIWLPDGSRRPLARTIVAGGYPGGTHSGTARPGTYCQRTL